MPKYLVIKVEMCDKCNGSGYIDHPMWAWYWRENAQKYPPDRVDEVQWFSDLRRLKVGALIWFLFETDLGDLLCKVVEKTRGQALVLAGRRLALVPLRDLE
jgi:hypothetical protein